MSKILLAMIAGILILCSCSSPKSNDIPVIITDSENLTSAEENYENHIDKFIFLGESTTYHLKNRGVLSGGQETLQVWGPKSGTLMLDQSINECRIVYPETKEELELSEALKRKSPEYIMFTFGLNGATNFISRGAPYFKYCYQKLIDTVKENSKNTVIIINSCFPIAQNMDMSNYTITTKELNDYINTINIWAQELAQENDLQYIDTASALKNKDGFLKAEYQMNDGFHLNSTAYIKILDTIKKSPTT